MGVDLLLLEGLDLDWPPQCIWPDLQMISLLHLLTAMSLAVLKMRHQCWADGLVSKLEVQHFVESC